MAKDKDELVLNPITGKLDTIRTFNENRILTHSNSSTGNPLMTYDPILGVYVEADDAIVTDNNGNIVST